MKELHKVAAYHATITEVSEFYEWLENNGYEIVKSSEPTVTQNFDRLLYKYLDIDTKKLEEERRELLDKQRELTEETSK